MLIAGAPAAVIGILLWILTERAATACSSPLIAALDSGCTRADAAHTIGAILAVGGVALFIAGLAWRR